MKTAPLVHNKVIGVVQVRHTKEERCQQNCLCGTITLQQQYISAAEPFTNIACPCNRAHCNTCTFTVAHIDMWEKHLGRSPSYRRGALPEAKGVAAYML